MAGLATLSSVAAPAAYADLSTSQIRFDTIRVGERSREMVVRACNPAPVGTQLDISFTSPWSTGVVQGQFELHGPQQYGLKGGPFRKGECHNTYFQMVGMFGGRDSTTVYFHFDNRLGPGWVETVELSGTVIDATAPQTEVSGPTGLITDTTPTFRLDADEAATFECSLNDADWEPCDSPYTAGPLDDGTYVLKVRSQDMAGNVDASPAELSFEVRRVQEPADETPPTPAPSPVPVPVPTPGLPAAVEAAVVPALAPPALPMAPLAAPAVAQAPAVIRPAHVKVPPTIAKLRIRNGRVQFNLTAAAKVRLTAEAGPLCKRPRTCGYKVREQVVVTGRKGRSSIHLRKHVQLLRVLRSSRPRLTAVVVGTTGKSGRAQLYV